MKKDLPNSALEPVAGNGLLHRRLFLTQGAAVLGTGVALLTARNASAAPLEVPATMKTPGTPASGYGERSHFESNVQRIVNGAAPTPGTGGSRTPLEHLEGIITPNGLHFERHHNGIPDIDPGQHRVLIHGLVERPLVFSLDALSRYPLVSRIQFLECSGNSARHERARACAAERGWAARPRVVRELDRRAAVDPAPGSRRETRRQVVARRRRGRRRHEPQRAAREGLRRCDPRAVPERRAVAAVERLPRAAVPAGLRRQHEREVAAAHQGHGRAHDDEGRDVEVHRSLAERPRGDVHVPDGREVRHHFAFGHAEDAGRGVVPDLRRRVVGRRQGSPRRRLRGPRQDLGTGEARRARAVEGRRALPVAVALGRRRRAC